MKYMLNEEKMFMDISDGIALIINSETGIYFGLNAFGTQVFNALVSGMDTVDVMSELKKLKNAPNDMEERLNSFIADLLEYELLVSGPAGVSVAFDEQIAENDNFDLQVTSYDDAQEMLLADPIHEVKETTGWTPETESIGYSKEETKEREKKVQ